MSDSRRRRLEQALEHAAHLLPAQGPISIFVHHNTLHAFERLPFETALVEASELFGTEPFLSEERYRRELHRGRILRRDLSAVIAADLGDEAAAEVVAGIETRAELRLALLLHELQTPRGAELDWMLAEAGALETPVTDIDPDARERLLDGTRRWFLAELAERGPVEMGCFLTGEKDPARSASALALELGVRPVREELEQWLALSPERVAVLALWRACVRACEAIPYGRALHSAGSPRARDLLLAGTGRDTDELVVPAMIRLAAAYLDLGIAYWPMPERKLGFWRAFLAIEAAHGSPAAWRARLPHEARRLQAGNVSAEELILESLDAMGIGEDEWSDFVTRTLLPLRGWAGIFHQLEVRPDRAPAHAPPSSLLEFLAVRVLLDRLAADHVAGEEGVGRAALDALRHTYPDPDTAPTVQERAFPLFEAAQMLGLSAGELEAMEKGDLHELVGEIEWFDELERRRMFHLAYEYRHRRSVLDSIAAHRPPEPKKAAPFQAIFCLDDREESLRRHLEEAEPECETFGSAGFFGVAMYYRGVRDAYERPLCPIVMRPRHRVAEKIGSGLEESHRRNVLVRRGVATLRERLSSASRTLAGGTLLAAGLGILAAVPLVLRVLFPRHTARLRRHGERFTYTTGPTALALERTGDPGPDGIATGFTLEEQAGIVRRLLEETGLPGRTAPLVAVIGHGSSSLNNPHESAYDCGACGGGRGGPNARAFAQMANDPRVRELAGIPEGTLFVGAYHDTCDDSIVFYDRERVPAGRLAELERLGAALDRARAANSHERCRRFESAPLWLAPEAALEHVEGRSQDLAQPRPELGHATNAVCVIGRRSRTRGLFLDRRAFLVSYDPPTDPTGAVLDRLLHAVLPVCAGINLEYFFSHVDPSGFGSGTKLPHNITSMLGVMDGHLSDLRSGLPWQMVEIHEPVRLLTIVETTPHKLLAALGPRDPLRTLIGNRWIQLVTLDPDTGWMSLFRETGFVPYEPEQLRLPAVRSSADWYRMRRDALPSARVGERRR